MGAHEITAIIPWLAYTKQDKVFRPGDSLSVKVIAKLLQTIPLKKVFTFDLHNLAILGFFEIPVVNIMARSLFLNYFEDKITDNTIVVAPDAGAIKTSTNFAEDLGIKAVYMDKKRDVSSGKVQMVGISSKVSGADVIMVDDMIVTGGTVVEAAKFLKEKKVNKITVCATHHLYVPKAQEKIEAAGVDKIVVTDTVKKGSDSKKLEVLTVSSVVADEIVV